MLLGMQQEHFKLVLHHRPWWRLVIINRIFQCLQSNTVANPATVQWTFIKGHVWYFVLFCALLREFMPGVVHDNSCIDISTSEAATLSATSFWHIWHEYHTSQWYATDLKLLSPGLNGSLKMVTICEHFCERYSICYILRNDLKEQ